MKYYHLCNYYCSGPSPDAPACSKASNYGQRWQLLSTGETFAFSFLSFCFLFSWQRSLHVKLCNHNCISLISFLANIAHRIVPCPIIYYLWEAIKRLDSKSCIQGLGKTPSILPLSLNHHHPHV